MLQKGSPIFHLLNRHALFRGEHITLDVRKPEGFEDIRFRVFHRDPIEGCTDPDFASLGERDEATVEIKVEQRTYTFKLYCFLAHLATAASLEYLWIVDEEDSAQKQAEEAKFRQLFGDGTWAGALFWDSAIHTSELMLSTPRLQRIIKGANVVELGCGLGLPGFICHALGAETVALTDREDIAHLCTENINRGFDLASK
eukprot:gene17549-20895_t